MHSITRSVPSVPVISHSTCCAIPELVRCRPCQSYRILLAVPFQNSFGVVRASHIAFYLQCHSRTRSVSSVPVISHSTCNAITELVRCRPCQSFYLQCHSGTCSVSSVLVISHSTCSAIPELVRCRPCQSYRILHAVPFQNSFGAVRASHIAFYLQCHSRTRSVSSVPIISHSTCSAIPELVRCRPCQSYRILLAVPFQNSFGVVRASHIAFYLQCHSRTRSVSSVPVISHSTCSAIPELVRCRPCQSYRILLAVSFQNSFGVVRANHITFYLQCHSRTRSVPSVPVISHSTCSAIPELVRCRPCSHIAFYLQCHSRTRSVSSVPVISHSTSRPFQNSFGAVRASHIAFYLQCHSRTRSVSSVPVISHSTCSAIPELVRCCPCQSYRILLAVPFQNSFGVVRASHIAFYLQCHSRTRSVSSVPVISHSTCSAIPELVRCRPCQSYRILLAVPFQNSFGVVRASHITFYLQCHSRTRSVPSVPVISHSTCSAIPELVRCRPCQSYRILLAVPFRNSFGAVRASHITFYLQCHSGTCSVSSVPVISHSTCSVMSSVSVISQLVRCRPCQSYRILLAVSIPELVRCRPCQSYRILLAVPFQNSFGAVRASHITFYLQCHSRTRSVPSVPVISHSTYSAIPELVRCRPCQSYRILLAVPFRNSFGAVRASHIAFYLQCHYGTRSVPSVPVISHSTCSAIPELVRCRPCQSYHILLAVPFQNSFGAVRANHIAFYLQCHYGTRSVSSVPVISHSTCNAITELVRCRPCQSYRILLAVPFRNLFGVVRASHIAFYLQCHSRTRSVSSVPVISHSTCSAIPELVRCRPCQSYRILLAVPFQNSFGVVRASHIAFYLQCHYGTRSVSSVLSHSTCNAITELVRCRPCQSYHILLTVPFQNSFGVVRVQSYRILLAVPFHNSFGVVRAKYITFY